MVEKDFSAVIKTDFSELEEVSCRVHDFLVAADVSDEVTYKIELALEEMVTNVIKYGYAPPNPDNSVRINVNIHCDSVSLRIEDSGHEFDPLAAPTPDISGELDKRPVGGVGIHLTRNMTDAMEYIRRHDKNILKIQVNR